MLETRNISNSEVTTFLSCKRQYEFAFVHEIEPKETSTPLARGGVGHEAFDYYIKARIEGASHEKAMNFGLSAFGNQDYPLDARMEAQYLWNRYMVHHNGWPDWELLDSEEKLILPVTSSINMVIRYDLRYRDRNDGKVKLLDWKFSYDFWREDDHTLNAQMPKYIAVMKANDMEVDAGVLAEIRTRKLGKEKTQDPKNLWKYSVYRPSRAKMQNMLKQHVAASLEIEKYRALPPEERAIQALPVLNKYGACKYCNFKDLCNSMNEGMNDLTVAIREDYKDSTYGYNKPEVDF